MAVILLTSDTVWLRGHSISLLAVTVLVGHIYWSHLKDDKPRYDINIFSKAKNCGTCFAELRSLDHVLE